MAADTFTGSFDAPSPRLGLAQEDKLQVNQRLEGYTGIAEHRFTVKSLQVLHNHAVDASH
jgi:hypothetical protein